MGQDAVAALRNMESNFPLTEKSLGDLQQIATPSAAKVVLPTMQNEHVTRKDLEMAISNAVHDQYVDWHWCEENPNIHPEKGMPPSLLCLGWVGLLAWALTGMLCDWSHKIMLCDWSHKNTCVCVCVPW